MECEVLRQEEEHQEGVLMGWSWKASWRKGQLPWDCYWSPNVISNCLIASFQPKGLSSVFALCDFSVGLDSAPCSLLHSFGYLPNIYWEYSLCAEDGDAMVGPCFLWYFSWFHACDHASSLFFMNSFSFLLSAQVPCPPWPPSNLSNFSDFEKSPMIHKSQSLNASFLLVSIVHFQWFPGYLTWGWVGAVLSTLCQALY